MYGFTGSRNKFALPPEEARRLMPTLKTAFVIAPQPPFYARGERELPGPSIDNPREIEEVISVVVADIQCGLLLNGANAVLGAYATR